MTEPLHHQTLPQLRAALDAREVSAVELAQHFLQRIARHADLGAFLATDEAVTLDVDGTARELPYADIARALVQVEFNRKHDKDDH